MGSISGPLRNGQPFWTLVCEPWDLSAEESRGGDGHPGFSSLSITATVWPFSPLFTSSAWVCARFHPRAALEMAPKVPN